MRKDFKKNKKHFFPSANAFLLHSISIQSIYQNGEIMAQSGKQCGPDTERRQFLLEWRWGERGAVLPM